MSFLNFSDDEFHRLYDAVRIGGHGLIAVSDAREGEAFKIIKSAGLKGFLGYEDGALDGRRFNILLQKKVAIGKGETRNFHALHDDIMRNLKAQEDSKTARDMAKTRTVFAMSLDRSPVQVIVRVSYQGNDADKAAYTGAYFAIVAAVKDNEDEVKESLNTANAVLSGMLSPALRAGRRQIDKGRRRLIQAVAGGTFFPAATVFLTQFNSFRAAWVAFWFKKDNPKMDESKITEIIGDDTRFGNIRALNEVIQANLPNQGIIAVAYFVWVYGGGAEVLEGGFPSLRARSRYIQAVPDVQLKYVDDSKTLRNKYTGEGWETWFYDSTEDLLILTAEQKEALIQHDCVYVKNAGYFPQHPEKGKFDAILCSTLTINRNDRNSKLLQFFPVNVAAIAVLPGTNKLEPYATSLWSLSVNLEGIYSIIST